MLFKDAYMNRRCFTKALLILFMSSLTALIVFKLNLHSQEGYEAIGRYINSFGSLAALIYIIFFTLRTLVFVLPYFIMVIIGGNIFGQLPGFLYSMAAVFTSASLAFFLARYLGKDFARRFVKGKLQELDFKVETHGFRIILLMRLSSVVPFDIFNYAAGVTRMRYKDFILGTVLGIIPETFSLTYVGSNIFNPLSGKFLAALGLLLLTVAIPYLYSRFMKKK